MIDRIGTIVEIEDLAKLLIGTQLSGSRGLLDAKGSIASGVLLQVGGGNGGVGEGASDNSLLDERDGACAHAGSAVGEGAIGPAPCNRDVALHSKEAGQQRTALDLVCIPASIEPRPAAAYISDAADIAFADFALHDKVPHVNGRHLQVLIEDSCGRCGVVSAGCWS